MKNICVFSFPRSGTHFLINSISLNFAYYSNHRMIFPITDDLRVIETFFLTQERTKRIYKSHMQFTSIKRIFHRLRKDWIFFYIMRDGRDAITSMYNMYKNRNKWKGPMSQFLRSCPPKDESALKVSPVKPITVLDLWKTHIEKWLFLNYENVFYLHYEDLINKFGVVLSSIGEYLNCVLPQTLRKPSKTDNVVCPGPGLVGNYRKVFTEEDNQYYLFSTSGVRRDIMINDDINLRY